MTAVWLLLTLPAAAFVLTALVRRYAVATDLLDVPNRRSSHSEPVPRGGGLTIVAIVLLALPLLWFEKVLDLRPVLALGVGGLAVAAVGWWDDRNEVPAHWRLLVHLLAAVFVLAMAGGIPSLASPAVGSGLGLMGTVGAVLFIAWVLNLYNFMDGIDGIAGVESVSVAGIAGLLLYYVGEPGWALLSAVVSLASLGFLAWNWPPAKIFMGDAGSGFLGFVLGAMVVLTCIDTPLTVWVWLILLGAFVVDASLTLIRRALRGERVYEAHRSHAYQHAATQLGAHKPVTIAILSIDFMWLGPWAFAATIWRSWGALFVAAAWLPLVLLCLRFRAGLPEE